MATSESHGLLSDHHPLNRPRFYRAWWSSPGLFDGDGVRGADGEYLEYVIIPDSGRVTARSSAPTAARGFDGADHGQRVPPAGRQFAGGHQPPPTRRPGSSTEGRLTTVIPPVSDR